MRSSCFTFFLLLLILSSCAHDDKKGTIAELESVQIELKDTDVDDGLDKAMQGYQKFLEETPESQLTPEAIRRLADLKIEKEYGIVTDDTVLEGGAEPSPTTALSETETTPHNEITITAPVSELKSGKLPVVAKDNKTDSGLNSPQRQSKQPQPNSADQKLQLPEDAAGADLENANAEEAIDLYKKLLDKYPMYERNDQVLYQLSRAYEETGQVDKAMDVMNRLVKQFPNSRYSDEVHFRRGEYYFTRKKFLDAEEAYGKVLALGVGSIYYDRALYKKGWALYKQELYEEALVEFFALLDYKVSIGYDFEQTTDNIERKRISDTFRVVSLSFSNLGGPETVQGFFAKNGSREYEHNVYRELAEFYFSKRRYSDAATTYNTFIDSNPFHKKSPHFSMRVITIYMKGGFPRLVIEAKKQFASTYGLNAEYWSYFNQAEFPDVLGYLKTNLTDLANHYHSLYQNKKFKKERQQNYLEASHWYREFLKSFPKDIQSPAVNYQLADLYLENKDFKQAAVEYEHSAYDYSRNDKSEKAAYAAVYAYREHLKTAPAATLKNVKLEIIRTSIRLADTFPQHEKVTIVLGAAVDDLFNMRDFTLAIKVGRRLIKEYPNTDKKITRGAWLVVAHSSFELKQYQDAEAAYSEVLSQTATDDKERVKLIDNLAASIYKQGEQARSEEKYREAVNHFLRIATLAPTSKIRPTAEYDAAAVLIQIMDLEQAVSVLLSFRNNYPENELQKDVTKKIAYAYKEMEKYTLAAEEYERVAAEANQEEFIREAMLQAAELYEKAKDADNSLRVYKQFVAKFPKPLEFALDTYYKIAMIYKAQDDLPQYRKTLQHIIKSDAQAGNERTDRTRYLAAQSSLVIIEPEFDEFASIRLVKPFKKSLLKKKKHMKSLVASYTKLVDYGVADVTAASTYYIAEIYYNFNRALLESEKPDDLNAVEQEEFMLMVEEQAYPFEEKAIQAHEKNIELLGAGIYSKWIDRSIAKLAKLVPARYSKPEESISYIADLDKYIYSSPRFVREDALTGYIIHLDFYRYASQKKIDNYHKNQRKVDIENRKHAADASGEPKSPNEPGVHQADPTAPETEMSVVKEDAVKHQVNIHLPEVGSVNTSVPIERSPVSVVKPQPQHGAIKPVPHEQGVAIDTQENRTKQNFKTETVIPKVQDTPSTTVKQKDVVKEMTEAKETATTQEKSLVTPETAVKKVVEGQATKTKETKTQSVSAAQEELTIIPQIEKDKAEEKIQEQNTTTEKTDNEGMTVMQSEKN